VEERVPVAPPGLEQADAHAGSSDSRAASTLPALPPPMMMKS
jgi:hypothetical protein